jgi:two-component system, OmpR family, sensor histidine kinase KdpD
MERLLLHLPRHPLGRHLVGLAGVAAITGILELALDGPNTLAVGAPYQLWVLVVSGLFGTAVGLVTSLAAVAALNWFFIAPVHTFAVNDSSSWVSLGLFAATALITSQLAAAARRQQEEAEARRRDAELLATLARSALAGIGSGRGADEVASAAAKALGVSHCEITLGAASPAGGGPTRLSPSARGFAIPLVAEDGLLGLLEVGPSVPGREPRWRRPGFADAVATLVSLAVERARLLDQALDTESLRRSEELKTALLRTVSHELRTPLTAIRTAGEALAEPGPADADALVAVVRSETELLERLVANLLDLSRLEAGALFARPDWCDPTELVMGAIEAAAPLLDGYPVTAEVDGELPLVRADAVLCERILVNLLHNAARHGAPPIAIQAGRAGDRLELSVADAGKGVAPDVRAHLFEPFVSGARGGTGVGLALSRGLAEAQGGTLRLEAGERTRFVLALPLEPVPEVVDG